MSTQPLHLTEPDEQPAPRLDDQSAVAEAVDTLRQTPHPYWLGHSAVRLHALLSLIRHAEQLLPHTVADARDQDLTWKEIRQLLNASPATAARRYRPNK